MHLSALCRSRRELSNPYFVAKFGLDTVENAPCFSFARPTEVDDHAVAGRWVLSPSVMLWVPVAGGRSASPPLVHENSEFGYIFLTLSNFVVKFRRISIKLGANSRSNEKNSLTSASFE